MTHLLELNGIRTSKYKLLPRVDVAYILKAF